MLVAMRLYGWSYAQAEYFVNDSLVLRQFCRVYLEKVPDDTVLIRWANTIGPQTVQKLNDRVVQLAKGQPVVTDGPYPETQEVLAGYTIVECDTFDRATEIAAGLVNPDADGEYVDVRPILGSVEELQL